MENDKKFQLSNKSYSLKKGTYNAMWLDKQGEPALWGSYSPFDGSYYLATSEGVIASGMWLENWEGDYEFQSQGCYHYDDVRRAIQLGIF